MICRTFALCLIAVAVPAYAQETTQPAPAPAIEGASESPAASANGKIVMYRPSSLMGYAVGCPIRFKGQEVIELGRGKYAEWAVPKGHYILTNKTSSIDVTVDSGGTSYVRCVIKPGFMTGRADLQIADQESFAEHQKDYEKKEVELSSTQ